MELFDNDKLGALDSLNQRKDITDFNLDFRLEKDLIDSYNIEFGARFNFLVNDTIFELKLGLNSNFPFSLPDIFIDKSLFGIIPHIMQNGWICYYEKQGLTIDYNNSTGILHNALDLVKKKILSLSELDMKKERLKEFEFYWNKLPDCKSLSSLVDINDDFKEVIMILNKNKKLKIISESTKQMCSYLNTKELNNSFTVVNCIYLPLSGNELDTPHPVDGWSIDDIRKIIKTNIESEKFKKFIEFVSKRKIKEKEFVLISFPRNKDADIFIGLEFRNSNKLYPLLDNSEVYKITPYKIDRYDSKFITKRGGAYSSLENKSILLIGLGSLGSFIASGLVEAGINDLTFIDKEKFDHNNIYRHLMGRSSVGKNKSEAIKTYLENEYPYLNINSYASDILKVIHDESINLKNYDQVIVSVGDPTLEFQLNLIFSNMNMKNVFFTWLEPLDIGGHLLKINYNSKGCYKCLYNFTEVNNSYELYNESSFFEAGQKFEIDMEGCGTTFSPYGVNSAKKTALLVIDNVIDTLLLQGSNNEILSWKGNPRRALQNGSNLSKRFYMSLDKMKEGGSKFINDNCEVCSEG